MIQALLSATGWFAGLLIVMIVVTALFGLILWIALKPIKRDELDDSASTKKALGRREAELANELLNKQHDESERRALEGKLREVKTAEQLVSELMDDGEKNEAKPAHHAKPARKPVQKSAQKPVQKPVQKPDGADTEPPDKK